MMKDTTRKTGSRENGRAPGSGDAVSPLQADGDQAERAYRDLVRRDPGSVAGYRGWSSVLSRQGRYREVVELLESVAPRLDSPHLWLRLGEAHRVLALRGEVESVDRAIDAFASCHRIRPEPVSLYCRAHLLLKFRGDAKAALDCYEAALHLDPDDDKSYRGAMHCLQLLGRRGEAAELQREWLERKRQLAASSKPC